MEKATLNVKDPGNVRGIFDVVRGMATCPTLGAVADVLNKLATCEDIEPVRCKERFFTAPSQGGWRDCMVCFVIKGDVNRHVCELQIAHRDMLVARKGLPGHAVYNRIRNASELLDVVFTRTLTPGALVSGTATFRAPSEVSMKIYVASPKVSMYHAYASAAQVWTPTKLAWCRAISL